MAVLLTDKEKMRLTQALLSGWEKYVRSAGDPLDDMALELHSAYLGTVNADTTGQVRHDLRRATPAYAARIIRKYAPQHRDETSS